MSTAVRIEADLPDLQAAVWPYHYNPSAWRQRVPICILAIVAAIISAHLALFQWRLVGTVWDPVFGEASERVIGSDVAKRMYRWIGIHDAALGAFAYLGDALFGFAGSTRRWQYRPWMVILFGIDVIPLGIVSAVLVLIQTLVLGDWCFLCLVTAAISLILVYLAWDEVRVSCTFLWRVWRRSASGKTLWRTFWGYRNETAELVAEEMVAAAPTKS